MIDWFSAHFSRLTSCCLSNAFFSLTPSLQPLRFYLYLPVFFHPSPSLPPSHSLSLLHPSLFSRSSSVTFYIPLNLSCLPHICLSVCLFHIPFPPFLAYSFPRFPSTRLSKSVLSIIFTPSFSLSFALRLHILVTLHAAHEIFRETTLQREANV